MGEGAVELVACRLAAAVAEDVMVEPTLPAKAPFIHKPPVWSRKFLSCAVIMP